jgi:hypothetical protein
MTDENNTPIEDEVESTPAETVSEHPPEEPVQEAPVQEAPAQEAPAQEVAESDADADMSERLERLGGEPAPVITPEEFARLQKAGQVHIDARGRVRTSRRSDAEAGVSLRKRRAWY